MKHKQFITTIILILLALSLSAQTHTFSSSAKQTTLIELYTSEGCSSCPPADQFLSQFEHSDELWINYIPLAFHVDYWDYIGWRDVFAVPEYSNRQRKHRDQGNISSVYTPGFVVNGKEWAGFFKLWRALPTSKLEPGILSLTIKNHRATINFDSNKTNEYNLAVLGMGLATEVKAGENNGDKLHHDFVVLDHQSITGKNTTSFDLPLIVKHLPQQFAVVAWVSPKNSLQPIQAVGGFLPGGVIKVLY